MKYLFLFLIFIMTISCETVKYKIFTAPNLSIEKRKLLTIGEYSKGLAEAKENYKKGIREFRNYGEVFKEEIEQTKYLIKRYNISYTHLIQSDFKSKEQVESYNFYMLSEMEKEYGSGFLKVPENFYLLLP